MPVGLEIAAGLIDKLDSLPYSHALSAAGRMVLIETLAREAQSPDEANSAIMSILTDTMRASFAETNRMPSPGELLLWLHGSRTTTSRPSPACRRCGGLGDVFGPVQASLTIDMPWEALHAATEAARVPCPVCGPGNGIAGSLSEGQEAGNGR